MKCLIALFITIGSNSAYSQSIEADINLLARKISIRAQLANKLSQDEKILLVKALNSADSILSRVAEGGSEIPGPGTSPGVYVRSCENESMSELKKALEIVKNFAYSSSGPNMYSSEAEIYAREWVKKAPCSKAHTIEQDYKKIYEIAYSGSYMNMSSKDATAYTLKRLPGVCQNTDVVSEFKQSYEYAFSISGLNLSGKNATQYASERIEKIAFNCFAN